MKGPSIQLLAGGVVAAIVGVSLDWFAGYTLLAAVTGVVWGGWVAILVRIRQTFPAFVTGDGWGDGRWTAVGVGLTNLAALLGVGPWLPVASELRVALAVLVLGVGNVGYMAATMAELERGPADGQSGRRQSDAGPAESVGD